jgi:hypothetical protein
LRLAARFALATLVAASWPVSNRLLESSIPALHREGAAGWWPPNIFLLVLVPAGSVALGGLLLARGGMPRSAPACLAMACIAWLLSAALQTFLAGSPAVFVAVLLTEAPIALLGGWLLAVCLQNAMGPERVEPVAPT